MRCMTDLLYCTLASGRNLNVYGNWFVRRYVRRGGVCDYCACTTAKCCRSEERNNNTNYNSNLVELSAHARFSVLSSRISRQQLSQRKKHNDKRGSAYPTRKRTRTTMGTARAEPKKVLPFTENVARHAQNAAGQTFLSPQWCALMAVNPREAMARVRCRPRAACPCNSTETTAHPAGWYPTRTGIGRWQVAVGEWERGELRSIIGCCGQWEHAFHCCVVRVAHPTLSNPLLHPLSVWETAITKPAID